MDHVELLRKLASLQSFRGSLERKLTDDWIARHHISEIESDGQEKPIMFVDFEDIAIDILASRDHTLVLAALRAEIIPIELVLRSPTCKQGCPIVSDVIRTMLKQELAKAANPKGPRT